VKKSQAQIACPDSGLGLVPGDFGSGGVCEIVKEF